MPPPAGQRVLSPAGRHSARPHGALHPPRTAVLGGLLLTGYLGGGVAANLRLENSLFSHTLFPVYFGVLVWAPRLLRNARLVEVLPLVRRREGSA